MANTLVQGLSHAHGNLEIFRLLHLDFFDPLAPPGKSQSSAMKMTECPDSLTGSRCSSPFSIMCRVDKLGENKS